MNTLSCRAALCMLLLVSPLTFANPPKGGKPPQEAIDACVDKSEGDSVSFETPHGDTVTGICKNMREGLVAVSEGREREER